MSLNIETQLLVVGGMTTRTACGSMTLRSVSRNGRPSALRGLELAVGDALDAGAEHFRRIGRHDEGKCHGRRNPGRQADADEGQGVVDQDEHDQHGHGAEDVDVADGEPAERLWRIEAYEADQQPDGHADADAQQPEQQRIDQAAHQRRQGRQHDLAVEEGVEQSHGRLPPEHRDRTIRCRWLRTAPVDRLPDARSTSWIVLCRVRMDARRSGKNRAGVSPARFTAIVRVSVRPSAAALR